MKVIKIVMEYKNTITTENYFTGSQHNEMIKKPTLPIHEKIMSKLEGFLRVNKVPNLLFHGTSGSGKRTIVNTFINKIYNHDKYRIKQNVMSVNCSHGKGIKFIREDLKFFAKTNIQSENGKIFKTIVLLNADFLTIDAQSALRRCIELFSHNTRFFIIVENKHKLLNPILSRFCEIYVPEYMEENKLVNLHEKMNRYSYNIEDREKAVKYISLKIEEIDIENITHSDIVHLVGEIYEKGYSCIDLIRYVEQNENISNLLKYEVIIYYEKVKSEYRSEPLLMFTILDYMYLRENKNICF